MRPTHAHARHVRHPAPTLAELIAALRRDGCRPREARPGVWVASCPICKLDGHPHALYIVADDDGEIEVVG